MESVVPLFESATNSHFRNAADAKPYIWLGIDRVEKTFFSLTVIGLYWNGKGSLPAPPGVPGVEVGGACCGCAGGACG